MWWSSHWLSRFGEVLNRKASPVHLPHPNLRARSQVAANISLFQAHWFLHGVAHGNRMQKGRSFWVGPCDQFGCQKTCNYIITCNLAMIILINPHSENLCAGHIWKNMWGFWVLRVSWRTWSQSQTQAISWAVSCCWRMSKVGQTEICTATLGHTRVNPVFLFPTI
jgi:hypothetical protein